MFVPKSSVLRFFLGWLAFAAVVSVLAGMFRPTTAAESMGAFLRDVALPYVLGAFGAGAVVVRLAAFVAGVVFATTTLIERFQSRRAAHVAIGAIALLSIVTLWYDGPLTAGTNPLFSWETGKAVVQTAISEFFLKTVDLAFTTAWIFVWVVVAREMDDELYAAVAHKNEKREMQALLDASFPESEARTPVIQPPPAEKLRCDVCNAELASTNRFCTRCGAPLPRTGGPS